MSEERQKNPIFIISYRKNKEDKIDIKNKNNQKKKGVRLESKNAKKKKSKMNECVLNEFETTSFQLKFESNNNEEKINSFPQHQIYEIKSVEEEDIITNNKVDINECSENIIDNKNKNINYPNLYHNNNIYIQSKYII